MKTSLRAYCIAATVLFAALLARLALDAFLINTASFALLYGAVAVSVWMAGYPAAVMIAILGYLAGHVLFQEPRGVFDFSQAQTVVGGLVYAVSCGLIIAIGESLHRAQLRERRLADSLEKANRRKNEFLAMLAHELRNPLAPLQSTLDLLKRGGGSDMLPQYVAMMERQLGQLNRLVDDLLNLSRITHGRLALRKSRTDLGEVIRQAVQMCGPFAQRADHSVIVTMPPAPLYVNADSARLVQVFANLLINSCKYTPASGQISISAAKAGTHVLVHVEDNGIGIAPANLERVFDMFEQFDQTAEGSQGGLGLGLVLVKGLVEMHGGAVEASSAGVGCGSRFTVRLPLQDESPMPGKAQVAAAPVALSSRRILIVDDNDDAATMLSVLLRTSGHDTCIARDGFHALEAAETFRPEVILLDIGLPGIDGLEVCRRLRRESSTRNAAIVAVTGRCSTEDRMRSREAGFDSHLPKPVAYDDIMQALGQLRPLAS